MQSKQSRFTVIDALRGIAAMAVVIFHSASAGHIDRLLETLPGLVKDVLLRGSLGVAVFFVLSGFVIAHSLYAKSMTPREFGRFTLKRSLRLDPPYWCSIAATICFAMFSTLVVSGKEMPNYSVAQIVAHIFYLQEILKFPAISSIYWTLCLEIQFYLIYALLMMSNRRRFFWICLACSVSLAWPLGVGPPVWNGLFLPQWHGFLVGAAAYWAWQDRRAAPFFLLFSAILIGAAVLRDQEFTLACALTALLIYGVALRNSISSALNWRWLQFLGLISYSLYLTHNIATGAVFRAGSLLFETSALMETVLWIVSIIVSIAFAAAFWRVVEQPSQRWSKSISQRDQQRTQNAAAIPLAPSP